MGKSNHPEKDKKMGRKQSHVPTEYIDFEMLQIKQMLARQRNNNFCACGTEYPSELKNCPDCA
jgi:hypothetical protein